jgi:hypothetical protein
MKFLVKTLLWMVLLVAVVAGIGREYVLKFWGGRDALIKQAVVKRLHELLPNATVEFDELNYDFGHEIMVTDFSLKPAGEERAIVRLPESIVHLNRDAAIDRQQLEVTKVTLRKPQLEVVRDRNGHWNWESLLPQSESGKGALPEIAVEDGTVTVRVEQTLGIPAGVLVLEHVDVSLVPSGKRQFLISAQSRCEQTGGIKVTGRWHIDQQTGLIDGEFTKINVGQELVGVAASFAPEVRLKLEEAEAKLWELLSKPPDPQNPSPYSLSPPSSNISQTAHAVDGQQAVGNRRSLGSADSILGLKATCNLQFRVLRPEPKQTPVFRVLMNITDGQITNPVLPFPLEKLCGELRADNDNIEVRKLSAENGATKVSVDGKLSGREAGYPGKFEISLSNLICDARLRSRLAAGFARLYDDHHPRGDVDMHCFVVHDADGKWRPEELLATAKDCSIIHEAFPYPVEHANGTIRQEGRNLIIEASGLASGRPITVSGIVENPGPNANLTLDINVADVPFDETFLRALKPDLQNTFRRMQLTGTMSGVVHLTKAPKQPLVPTIDATLRNGSVAWDSFPYRIEGLSGRLTALGTALWKFTDLKGKHGTAPLSANGSFTKGQGPGQLKLQISAERAPLDESLFRALPVRLKQLWREFSPTGTIDVTTEISLITGQPVDIRLPRLELTNGSIQLKSLPYQLDEVKGSFQFGPNEKGQPTINIASFTGKHGDFSAALKGYQRCEEEGKWVAHIDEFTINNLVPNVEFLKSLARMPGVQQFFANLDPFQALRLEGVMELRGTGMEGDPISAAWDVDTFFNNSTIRTGLDFRDLKGMVRSRGSWDGEVAKIEGMVNFESARILDYVLNDIRGPFRVEKGTLMFGAADVERVRPPNALDPREKLVAKLFGGTVTLDGMATLTNEPKYQVQMNFNNMLLQQFAALHAPKQRDLRGVVNGRINLKGKGSSTKNVKGDGILQISDAALLNVPVMLEMYNQLSLARKDSMFDFALFKFTVHDALFDFNQIVLDSETLKFRGYGQVAFNSDVQLQFISELGRNQVPIPLLHELLGEATRGWVGVEVSGKLDRPRTKTIAAPLFNDVLKALMGGTLPQPVFPVRQGSKPRGAVFQ